MDNEDNNNVINKKTKYKTKKGSRYENRKLLYIVLIVFIFINFFLTPFTSDLEIQNEISNINPNYENNKIEESANPLKINNKNKKDDIKEEKKEKNKLDEKYEDKNHNKLNEREAMKYINKSTRSYFQKFEMFSLFGFIGILLGLMFHNASKSGNEQLEKNNSNNKNEREKERLKENNKYHLLNDNDEDYYENI